MFSLPCRISHTIILDDPFDDPAGIEIPDKSPEPTEKQLQVTCQRLSYSFVLCHFLRLSIELMTSVNLTKLSKPHQVREAGGKGR